MSRLENLSTPVQFEPLIKLTKKEMKYVEDLWHHATLTYCGFTPSNDSRYNDFDYEEKEIFYIIKTFGVRPNYTNDAFWEEYGHDRDMTDDQLYNLAVLKTAPKIK